MEIVLSIIAIVISSVSLFFNAYPVYCKYMRKKEKTIMTITDGKVENNIIRLCVVYSNVEYRGIIITNSHIMLTSSLSSNVYTYSNKASSNIWIEPIVFTNKGNKSLILEYTLPDLSNMNLDDVNVIVKTNYIDSNGKNKCDDCHVGQLIKIGDDSIVAYVEHIGHVMKGKEVVATVK